MDAVFLLIRLLLSGTFGIAGFSKVTDPAGTRQSILDFGAPAILARPMAWLLPLAELACAIALLPAATCVWGAAGALALLLVFIVAIALNLARGRRPDCHCFGQLHSAPVGWTTLARNAILSALAIAVIAAARQRRAPDYLAWFQGLSSLEAAIVCLALALAAVAALGVWSLIHLLRQNGRLLLRLEAVETQLGIRTAPPEPGLPLHAPAPEFRLTALDGGIVTLEMLHRQNDSLLLIFTEPGCGGCDALLPDVAHWQQEHAQRLAIVLIGNGRLDANRAKASAHNLRNYLLQVNEEASSAYQAEGTPTAVLVRRGRVASPVASGADAIRELLAVAIQPPPLAKGELAPELVLPGLDGRTIALRGLRGRHLLLFWSPDCGYCQELLPEIKAWEQNPPPDAPRLLVISTGAPEANRAQGFRAPVLLDENFRTGSLFGAEGTPSAVLLDEEGRISSHPGVGGQEVLALARGTRLQVMAQ
jgi:thiol-disulfide isomerase/thioredoxin/uncharacterized membrane protein YphA (DoxX/SURF4 family)